MILDDLEARIEPLCRRLADAQWVMLTTGDCTAVEALEDERAAIYGDPGALPAVVAFDPGRDPILARRRNMLRRELLREAVRADPEIARESTRIATAMATGRSTLDGHQVGDAALQATLERDPDPARREAAWRARAEGDRDLAPALRRLAQRRNEQARGLGYPGYYALGLDVAALPDLPVLLRGLSAAVERSQGPPTLRPWDGAFDADAPPAADLPAHRAVSCALETFEAMGLSLQTVRLDLDARPGKSEHAWCVPVNPPADIRVSAVLTEDGPAAWETLLHELGHAAHATYVRGAHFVLRDGPNDAMHEGVAQLFGTLVQQPRWLEDVAGLTPGGARDVSAYLLRRKRRSMRWWLLRALVEESLLDGGDPSARYWELAAGLVGVMGVDPDPPDRWPVWAHWPHLATHPVYLQNYPVADLIAAQLADTLCRRFGRWWSSREAGRHLRSTLIEPGASADMDTLLLRATGAPLSVRAWVEAVGADPVA